MLIFYIALGGNMLLSFVKIIMMGRHTAARKRKQTAFSLVEMLMALLVASLLLAALAPVMTRRMADHEIKVLSEAANYDKDMVISIITEDAQFNIPQDANQVRLTLMGGGGAGGDALYGNKTFTTSGAFTVPKDVTKLRVFMVGGGGGGASGGREKTLAYGNIPAISNESTTLNTAGTYTFASGIATPSSHIAPALDIKCSTSGISRNWTIVSDNTAIAPNVKFAKFYTSSISLSKVTACGAGGGPRGGTGGYIANKTISYAAAPNKITVKIGAPGGSGSFVSRHHTTIGSFTAAGGAGGTGASNGTAGGLTTCYHNHDIDDCTGASGGGGSTGILNASNSKIFEISGGGGGGGYMNNCMTDGAGYGTGGTGGAGGGANSGLGGGGGRYSSNSRYAGAAASGYVAGLAGSTSSSNDGGYMNCGVATGGTGGGGIGGYGGGRGTLTALGSRCNAGQSGAMQLWYSAAQVANGLKCEYYIPSNGGGGGGAGQITINEISVTPNETLYFEIGKGGAVQSTAGKNGNTGGATHIRRGSVVTSPSIISAAGGYGGEYSNSSAAASSGGGYRNPNIGRNWTGIDYRINNSLAQGDNGFLASDSANIGYGGKGGSSQNIKGEILQGGYGGNSIKNGGEPAAQSYGAGGGGGSGVQIAGENTYGAGGAGASGVIYIEWGGTNGGGGSVGEIVKKMVTNFDGNDRKMIINIGKGGDGSNGGDTTIKVKSGGKDLILTARGGIKGKTGNMDAGDHGGETKYPDTYGEIYKEYVQGNISIATGQKASNEYGGTGGYLACLFNTKDEEGNSVCAATVKSNDGLNASLGPIRPGCGGTSILSPLYDSICNITNAGASPHGSNGTFGGGGGGGAVLNNTGGKGGNGGNGFVILEYKSTTLD